MSRNGFFRWTLAAAMAAIALIGVIRPGMAEQKRVIVVTPPAQIQVERDRQQARQFQLRQQLNREQDRQMNSQPQTAPRVPMMRPTCTPTNGVSCN